jgi:hypothetical protein
MFNDHLYFKIYQLRHAELIRQGEAQRLAESLVPKRQTKLSLAASAAEEHLEAWWEAIKRQLSEAVVGKQPPISDTT